MEPLFIDGSRGSLFGILHRSPRPPRQALLYIPPFAEENNRARHVAAALARQAAAQGISTLLLDPFGTGDSAGEFGEATWDIWLSDVRCAADWLRQETGLSPALLGLRTGALLAAEAARQLTPSALALWAPVSQGQRFIDQFLRLRVAAGVTQSGQAPETVADLRARIESGETLEIAGYSLNPKLVAALATRNLADLAPPGGTAVLWLEPGGGEAGALTPAARRIVEAWSGHGLAVTARQIEGPMFWQQQEPEPCPGLVMATLDWLLSLGGRDG